MRKSKLGATAAISAAVVLASFIAGCTTGTDDLGYAVTERGGARELIVDLCGASPPGRLTITRGPTGGLQDPEQAAEYAEPVQELVLFEVDESEWESDRRTFDLGVVSDAPPSMREFLVYAESSSAAGSEEGMLTLPTDPWPTHPLAFTSPFDFTRAVRLDTERGDLCQES